MKKIIFCFIISLSFFSCSLNSKDADKNKKIDFGSFQVVVEQENLVYSYTPPNNGSYPMWGFGNSSIVRYNNSVFVSGTETIQDVKGYNNTRWTLLRLNGKKWDLVKKDKIDHTREPSPLAGFSDGRIILSANPTLDQIDINWPKSEPKLFMFNQSKSYKSPIELKIQWTVDSQFNHHSYRSLAANGPLNKLIVFNHDTKGRLNWSLLEDSSWTNGGLLKWPWGEDYEVPQDIRICYPVVQMKYGQVHFLGVSDIPEPNKTWKDYKYSLTERTWDFDFRRLFYVYSKDISGGKFSEWIEIASREKTAGHIFPCDIWIENEEKIHILWYEQALDYRLKDKFFPDEVQTYALNYAVIENGNVIFQKEIMSAKEESSVKPYRGRFHVTPDNSLFVIYAVERKKKFSGSPWENRIFQISTSGDYRFSPEQVIKLKTPMMAFYTATQRNGSTPSWYIDILGDDQKNNMLYARVKIQ